MAKPLRVFFTLYTSVYDAVKEFSLEDKGRLLDAIYLYHIDGQSPEKDSPIYTSFLFYRNQFRVDDKKYKKFIQLQSEKGKKSAQLRSNSN